MGAVYDSVFILMQKVTYKSHLISLMIHQYPLTPCLYRGYKSELSYIGDNMISIGDLFKCIKKSLQNTK